MPVNRRKQESPFSDCNLKEISVPPESPSPKEDYQVLAEEESISKDCDLKKLSVPPYLPSKKRKN